ncbi:MAG: LysR family transcriptional regulator [Rubrivivax sp.]|nr:LysR family transcriptional regulator [Rubrivivax sp.]
MPRNHVPPGASAAALDLNLLRLFQRLDETRSVSRAAEGLNLTQPAASNALARLRRALGDPLFVASPAGMLPTPRAQQMAPAVAEALALLEGALAPRQRFAPQVAAREFRVGMSDIGEIYFLPRLMERLAAAAPAVTLSTVRDTAIDLKQALAQGQIDLAIGLLPQLRGGFHQRELFVQRYVCLLRAGHPLARRRLTLEAFAAAEHLNVVAAGTGHSKVDRMLERAGVRRNVRLSVPHFVAIGHILAATDLIATVPERLAGRLVGPFGLVSLAHPARLPQAPIRVFWHARVHDDAANRWLRQLVADTFTEASPPGR